MKLIYTGLILIVAISGYAQTDPEATKILDEVSNKALSQNALNIDFKYIINDQKENATYEQNGELTLKGKLYKLDLLGNTLYFDGSKNYNYIKEANEVNITLPDDNTDNIFFTDPSDLFTFYKEGYKSRLNSANENIADIDLFPSDIDLSYFRINFIVDVKNKNIKSFKVYGKEGVQYEIILKSIKPVQINDDDFKFNPKKYPGIEIIDMTE